MRTAIYFKERKIGYETIFMLCSFLNITNPSLHTKLTEEKIALFDKTINSDDFNQWVLMKLKIDKIEKDRINDLIKLLSYNSKTEMNELLAERIINALNIEIEKGRYNNVVSRVILNDIIVSDKTLLEKIKQLKESPLFAKPIVLKQPVMKLEKSEIEIAINEIEIKCQKAMLFATLENCPRRTSSRYSDSEEAIMRAIENGNGDQYGY